VYFLDLLTIIGMHLQNTADALALAFDRVINRVARIQEWIRCNLECECCERLVVTRRPLSFGIVIKQAFDRRYIDRRWHEFDNSIQHRLYALVLER